MSELDKLSKDTVVAIYNRVSTNKQVQVEAIERQVEDSRRIVEESGLKIYKQYIDKESGLSTKHRYSYNEMIRDMYSHKFDIVVAKNSDRLMRDDTEWSAFVRVMRETGVKVYFYLDDRIYNEDNGDDLIYGIQSHINKKESQKLSKKITEKHATRQRYAEGNKCLNITRPIFGWDRNVEFIDEHRKKVWYTVNEKEAEIIREALELVYSGMGYYKLANYMYKKGVVSKATSGCNSTYPKRISATGWKKICTSPLLHGEGVFNKTATNFYTKARVNKDESEWIHRDDVIEPIVTKEYHEKVLRSIESRSYKVEHDRSMIGRHFWSNKLICKNCGGVYYRYFASDTRISWRCKTSILEGTSSCNCKAIDEIALGNMLDISLYEEYRELYEIVDNSIIDQTLKVIESSLEHTDYKKEIKCIESKVNQLSSNLDVLFNKLMNNVISDEDFKIYKNKLENERSIQCKRLDDLKNINENLSNKKGKLLSIKSNILKQHYEKYAMTEVLKNCIENVVVDTNGNLEIHMNKDKMLERFEVLSLIEVEDSYFEFNTMYKRETKNERERRLNKEAIIEIMKTNKYVTLKQLSNELNCKYSYIYTSVKQLRDENKIEHINVSFDTNKNYWILK